jgi:hypothetical protein
MKIPFDSKHVARMVRALRCKVRGLSFLNGGVVGGVLSAVKGDASPPRSSMVFGHPKNARTLVVSQCGALVLRVDGSAHVSQVGDGIVRRISVHVIDVCIGPNAVRIEPRQAVKPVEKSVDLCLEALSVASGATNSVAYADVPVWLHEPREHAALRVVLHKLAQTLRGKIGLSHEAVLSLIGQRPARVDSTSGLRYFSARAD